MAENSKIEWTDHTVNFFIGCTKVPGSPACDNCYAQALNKRFKWVDGWGKGHARKLCDLDRIRRQAMAWNRAAAATSARTKVFANSLSDFFDPEVPDEWRGWAMVLIAMTPHLDWLILTKRAKEMNAYMSKMLDVSSNLWLGVTAENQATANERIPLLLDTPAAKRFVSMEPLLGRVDLTDVCNGWYWQNFLTGEWWHEPDTDVQPCNKKTGHKLDWVIAGGESGPKARPSHPDWFRSIRDQCSAAGVPFLFKQNGEWCELRNSDGGDWFIMNRDGVVDIPDGRWPDEEEGECSMIRIGKKAAGRLLDGELHDGRPS